MIAPSLMIKIKSTSPEIWKSKQMHRIKTLGLSGYDPYAMSEFFEKLSTGSDPRMHNLLSFSEHTQHQSIVQLLRKASETHDG